MIIHEPEVQISQGEVTISAPVEFAQAGTETPDNLWIKYPEKYAQWVTPRGDGFLVSLFLIAMYYQEDIEVRGEISPLLAYHFPVVVKLHHQIYPSLIKEVDVKFNHINALESQPGDHQGVGTAFSGGIDSSYTLWSHLPENQPIQAARITHGFFLHGFDILLSQAEFYARTLRLYTDLFDRLGLELIPVRTNVYSFYQFRLDWMIAYSPPLIGSVMHLERLLNRFYKPSGRTLIEGIAIKLPETGTATDHMLSTENLRVILDNSAVSRYEKVDVIKNWPEIRGTLRICNIAIKNPDHINCCSCGKCLMLMAYLEIMGDLENFSSFHKPFHALSLFEWLWHTRDAFLRAKMILKMSRKKRRWDIWLVMLIIYIPGFIKFWFFRLYVKFLGMIPAQIKYTLKSRIFPKNIEEPV